MYSIPTKYQALINVGSAIGVKIAIGFQKCYNNLEIASAMFTAGFSFKREAIFIQDFINPM